MGTLIGSTFRDALATQFNGTTQYGYIDNPTFKTDTQGAFVIRRKATTVLTGTGLKCMLGYGPINVANNSLWHFGQRYNGSATIPAPYQNQPIPDVSTRKVNAGAADSLIGQAIMTAGTWDQYVIQSNGTAWSIYSNGVPLTVTAVFGTANTGDWLGDISGTDHRLTFGCRFFSNVAQDFADVTEDEILYINRALTGGEITALYNGGILINPHRITSLGSAWKSWWRMGDSRDDATTVYDEIGTNNLTLVNSPSYVAA